MLNKEEVGKRIAFFRKEKGITQRELADFLHISYQAVSKWESGKSLPTVEMLYEISDLLNVTVDELLSESKWKSRRISYQESGLDTRKLHLLKKEIAKLNSGDKNILSADYADACLFQIDTSGMEEPVYSFITCVPGSKEKLAKAYRYNREICMDAAASAMNHLLQHGMKPVILKAMVVCGNYDQEQLYRMAQAFREICDRNQVSFAGMEISAQPVNFSSEEYSVSAAAIGVQDRARLLTGSRLQEGDVLIGIRTDGIDGTNYPFVKIMLDKKPQLYYAQIDGNRSFLDELMKATAAYVREIMALQEAGYLHKAFRIRNSLLNRWCWDDIPKGLGACIDLSAVPVLPLHRFLFEQDMIGEDVFAYHFNMGIGMVAAVPEIHWKEAMKVIGQFSECWRIGQLEADDGHRGEKVWSRGGIAMPLPLKAGYNFHYSHFRRRPHFEMSAAEAYTDFYGLSYTVSGDSICYSPEGISVYQAGDIALIPLNVYFRAANLSAAPREEILIKFKENLLSDLLEVMNVESFDELLTGQELSIHLKKNEQEKVRQIMEEIEREWDSYNQYSEIILKGLLNELLVLWLEKREGTEKSSVLNRNEKEEKTRDKLYAAIRYVESHLEKSPSLRETAGYLRISQSYLSKIFVEHLHTPYSAFILNEKILYAQKLLVDSCKDMAEVAKEAGFSSNTYFSDCFKRVTGMSPLQFRKAYKGCERKYENGKRSSGADLKICR